MSDGEALLRAILERPEEDTPRLMFADWLQENGDYDRSAFVRVQCLIAQLEGAGGMACQKCGAVTGWHKYTKRCRGRACRLRQREYYTSRRYCVWDWCRGIPAGSQLVYRRGFVVGVSCSLDEFMGHAAAIFSVHPIERVTLTDRAPTTGVFHRIEEPNWHLQGKRYWLWDMLRDGWVARHGLPWEIVRNLPRGVGATGSYQYLSQEDALTAATQACVAYGRSLAGLSQLVSA